MSQHLLHEEGVPFSLGVDSTGEDQVVGVEGVTRSCFDQGRYLALVESGKGQPLHAWLPTKVGEKLHEGMASGHLGVPVGPQNKQALAPH